MEKEVKVAAVILFILLILSAATIFALKTVFDGSAITSKTISTAKGSINNAATTCPAGFVYYKSKCVDSSIIPSDSGVS